MLSVMAACGLSPLARGTREDCLFAVRGKRFIPAGAGNTRLCHSTFEC
ncbi:hypothetical protein CDS [Salmonella enterica subsp. enterica serovar Derby]|nr:hypothetical protein CDS [Salmonella enterica subsp. enterica serovar Derby]VXG77116.1 hypothetical protein CDS [Salmonella enterica subsp. enterica serovar Derby]